jgi:hypothetical protein
MQTEKPWYNFQLRYFQLVVYTLSNLPWLDKISIVEKNATIDRRIDLTGACTIKKLRIHNLREMEILRSKLVPFLLPVTFTGLDKHTNTLAYYGIRKLRIRNVFIVQTPEI